MAFPPRIDGHLLRRFAAFSGIGVVNTGIHVGIVVALVESVGTHPVLANCLAFVAANAFSYWANSRWNYGMPMSRPRYLRFLAVSLAGLGTTMAMSAIAAAMAWHYLVGVAMVFVALPTLSFTAHHFWTWSDSGKG